MDYTQYTVEDLAADDSFVQWAHGSDEGSVKFWDDFVIRHPEMSVKIAQARALILNLKKAETIRTPEDDIESLWAGIERRITEARAAPGPIARKRLPVRYPVTAVFAMLTALVVFWYAARPGSGREDAAWESTAESAYIEEVNTSGNVLRVHLSDGSTVALENNSRLRYKKDFTGDSSRSVYLSGEAFFEVTKDPAQPFMVHANNVVTRVLGTSFTVKAPDKDGDVVVSVKTGKVSVYAIRSAMNNDRQQTKNAVVLLPNQQVTYISDQDVFGKALVLEPSIVVPSITSDEFVFENTPVKEVFRTLQRAYGIEIIFDEEVMNNCFFTAPLGSEPLYEKLKIICRTIGAHYEVIDAKVVITSTGC